MECEMGRFLVVEATVSGHFSQHPIGVFSGAILMNAAFLMQGSGEFVMTVILAG
jgi:hypothetical protein